MCIIKTSMYIKIDEVEARLSVKLDNMEMANLQRDVKIQALDVKIQALDAKVTQQNQTIRDEMAQQNQTIRDEMAKMASNIDAKLAGILMLLGRPQPDI